MRLFRRRETTASSSSDAERRPSRRVRPLAGQPIEVQIMGAQSIDVLDARDISATGLAVYVPHRFEGCDVHSEVALIIKLPRTRSFMAKGTVVHLTADERDANFGVEFTELADQHRAEIRAYIERVAAETE